MHKFQRIELVTTIGLVPFASFGRETVIETLKQIEEHRTIFESINKYVLKNVKISLSKNLLVDGDEIMD